MKTIEPLVSVVINNYNYGRFLKKAIESALDQSYRPLEVIVVDDGSTDNSREIIESFGERVRSLFQANGGQGSAFNAGVAASSGAWICFLDSDDEWFPNKIARVVSAVRDRPKVSLAYHQLAFQPPQGRNRYLPRRTFNGDIADKVISSGGWWAAPPTSALCLSREAARRIFPMNPAPFRICADQYLIHLAPLVGEVAGIAEVLGVYRLHGSNLYSRPADVSQAVLVRQRIQLYERFAAAANEKLAGINAPRHFSLDRHWFYQRLVGKEKPPTLFRSLGFALRALAFQGEPSLRVRVGMAVRTLLDATGVLGWPVR